MIGALWNSWQMRMHWIWLKAIFGWTLSRPLHVGLHVLIGPSDRPSTHPSVWWCMPTSVHPFVVYRFSLYVCNVLLSLLLNFEQAVYMFYLHFFSSPSARTQKVRSVGKFVSFFASNFCQIVAKRCWLSLCLKITRYDLYTPPPKSSCGWQLSTWVQATANRHQRL